MALTQWDWNDPALRAQVKVGTILLSDDGYRFVVRELAPEGVIVRELNNPRAMWPWSQLAALKCALDGEVDLSTQIGPGVTERGRGGVLPDTRQLSDAEWRRLTTEPRDVGQDLDAGLAAEMFRFTVGYWPQKVVLGVRIDPSAVETIAMTLTESGQLSLTAPKDARLRQAVYFYYRAAVERQPHPWNTMTFTLLRSGEDLRYEVEFGYHWDET